MGDLTTRARGPSYSAPLEDALRFVARGEPFVPADLEMFEDAESATAFVRRLAREGALEILSL